MRPPEETEGHPVDKPISYELIRSGRRTLALEVTADCRVVVRAPLRTGRGRIDEFVSAHTDWIQRHLERQRVRQALHPEPSEEERLELIRRAREILPKKAAAYGAVMGLHPAGITITGAKKRFGSCSGTNRICFSWRLMQYPEEAVDYVVVHELAHIRHKDHSRAFYDCVAQVLPDWKARRELLKR